MSANLHGELEACQTLDRLGDPWAALSELVGRTCGLSDEKLEVLAVDSMRIMRFLGVGSALRIAGARLPAAESGREW